MRRVKYTRTVYNNGKHEEEHGEGLFHCWGCLYEEFDQGVGNYTVAIIERDDGTITNADPTDVRFLGRGIMDEIQVIG